MQPRQSQAGPVNVLLIGGGGREHALALAIKRSKRLGTLFATHTTNPGIASLAKAVDVPVNIREIYRLQQFIEKHTIGLVVIGPEEPLADGFADKLASPTCKVFGPTSDGAKLEADKAWCKQLLRAASVPTAEARVFTDAPSAKSFVESRFAREQIMADVLALANRQNDPAFVRKVIDEQRQRSPAVAAFYNAVRHDLPVLKAAGLAKGKGVVLPASLAEAMIAIDDILVKRVHGDAGKTLLIEERLEGPEVSLLAITDGSTLLFLPPARDHKRLLDGDQGPNTGGMGAFCPAPTIDDATMHRTVREVFLPTLDALRREGIRYCGVLYAGLMLTHNGPRVLEFNCRFGDPECQVILPRLKTDIIEIMLAACDARLDAIEPRWDDRVACCVVLASRGYPHAPIAGDVITGIDEAEQLPGVAVLHAGTSRANDGTIVTAGGRVLCVVGLGTDLSEARERAYAACARISFRGMQVRSDIGLSAPLQHPRPTASKSPSPAPQSMSYTR
jgi:phosphoribosylamine--glycine ligase